MAWAHELGSETFRGLTKSAFPKAMKASPLFRAWLAKLSTQGVPLRTKWRWIGGYGRAFVFATPDGTKTLHPDVTILALGGASWPKLGSDGAWTSSFADKNIPLAPFTPCNVAGSHQLVKAYECPIWQTSQIRCPSYQRPKGTRRSCDQRKEA